MKQRVKMIAAVDQGNVLGYTNGVIPWRHKGDQRLFAEMTRGGVVVMGRVTWQAIPPRYRPLADRYNIVVSTTLGGCRLAPRPHAICETLPEALRAAEGFRHDGKGEIVWLIGGRKIYEEGLEYCEDLVVTNVPGREPETAKGLVYFPSNCQRALHDWPIKETRRHPYNDKLSVVSVRRFL
jgi:dihydrofolate reductase